MSDAATLARIVALTGSAISGILAVMIIFGVVWTAIVLGKVPDVLANWGGVIIGFFFGQFFSFVRGVLNFPEPSTSSPPSQ